MALALMMTPQLAPSAFANAPADDIAPRPEWSLGDHWCYNGSLLFVICQMSYNVTGKGSISSGGTSYGVYIVDTYQSYQLGALRVTTSGKDYLDRSTLALVKSERSSVNGSSILTTVTTYDPPCRLLNFPLELGKEWRENVTVTTEETFLGSVNKTTLTSSVSYKVSALETLNTPAGDFLCFRIDTLNETNVSLSYWYSSQVAYYAKLDIASGIGAARVSLTKYEHHMPETPPVPDYMGMFIVLTLIFVLIAVVVAAAMVMRRKKASNVTATAPAAAATAAPPAPAPQPGFIDDVFLIYGDGRLMHHDTRRLKPEIDDQILGSMFTAIQDFVGRSFPAPDGSKGQIKEIKYADSRILVERGKCFYIAVATTMSDTAVLQQRMAKLVPLIEAKCGPSLEKWDGNVESITEAKKLSRLLLTDEHIPDS